MTGVAPKRIFHPCSRWARARLRNVSLRRGAFCFCFGVRRQTVFIGVLAGWWNPWEGLVGGGVRGGAVAWVRTWGRVGVGGRSVGVGDGNDHTKLFNHACIA